ncbi:hypothetical protein UFOVP605_43 [uncultured Caudovirales phage]|uniref:Uncharacterized protein n=1 Tax=uncultured Caudovirales phage TaxID=2100421 RepID=A0A6J5N361_9CAUD|nr:hypothetical protein UFOVP605_43 [uncultured Caudovirales phage]
MNTTKTTKVVGHTTGNRAITAHITVAHLHGKPFHAVAHYTLQGCGLAFPSAYDARVHATLLPDTDK